MRTRIWQLVRAARTLAMPAGRIRLLLFGCAVAGLVLAVPMHLSGSNALLFAAGVVGLAGMAAAAPDGRWPAVVMYTAAICWVWRTTVDHRPVDPVRVGLLTCLLYLVHTLATLAAIVPADAVLPPGLLRRTLRRIGWVLAATAAVAVVAVSALTLLDGRTTAAAQLAVLAVVVAAVVAGRAALRAIGRSPERATEECQQRGDDSKLTT